MFVSVAWLIRTYNRFIKYKNRIEETWSGIDVALRRRFNLIPNLICAIGRYEEHETEIFKTKKDYLIGSDGISNRAEEKSRITKSLSGLLALAEAYPDLKASENFLDQQNSLSEIEEDIQKTRSRYNSSVARFNTLIESFPAKFIETKYGFEKKTILRWTLQPKENSQRLNFLHLVIPQSSYKIRRYYRCVGELVEEAIILKTEEAFDCPVKLRVVDSECYYWS